MRLEHHLVGGYVRYISPYIIIYYYYNDIKSPDVCCVCFSHLYIFNIEYADNVYMRQWDLCNSKNDWQYACYFKINNLQNPNKFGPCFSVI